MNGKQVVVGVFENRMYTVIAKRDLRAAGIRANILNAGNGELIRLLHRDEGVELMVPDNQVEKAKIILKIRFV